MPYLDPPVSFCSLFRFAGYREQPGDVHGAGTYRHIWVDPMRHPVALPEPVMKEEPVMAQAPVVVPVPVVVATPTLPDNITARLQAAFQKKAEAEAQGPMAAVELVQQELEAFTRAIRKQSEEKALAMMLSAVGEQAPTPMDLAPFEARLRTSLTTLLEFVGGDPFVPEEIQEPAPSGLVEVPSDVEASHPHIPCDAVQPPRKFFFQKPVVLVGGIPVPNKVASLYERFGVQVEWLEVYRNKGDAVAITRIRSGSAGAVIVLEKFLSHNTSEAVQAACRTQGIPWAFGGNAGTASIQRALEQIESKSAA